MSSDQFVDTSNINPSGKGKLNTITGILRNAGKKLAFISGVALFAATGAQASPQYQYNAANQLAKVTLEDGTIIENFYDGLGNLVRQAVNGNSRDIILNELAAYPTVIGVVPTSGDAERVVYGPDGAVAERSGSNGTRYLVKDQVGTIKGNADEAGNLLGRLVVSAYGVSRNKEGENSVLGYTGEYVDESGLVYLRARHYNPALARFVQKDSFEGLGDVPQTMNNYTYVSNRPLMTADPSGHIDPLSILAGVVVGAIIAGIVAPVPVNTPVGPKDNNPAQPTWKNEAASIGIETALGAITGNGALLLSGGKKLLGKAGAALIREAGEKSADDLIESGVKVGIKSNLPDWCIEIPDSEAAKIVGRSKGKRALMKASLPSLTTDIIKPAKAKGPITVDEAIELAEQFMEPGIPMEVEVTDSGIQYVQNFLKDGVPYTKRAGFDFDKTSNHVKKELGPHLNLQTQRNGNIIRKGALRDPHIPVAPDSISATDY